jgi:hypothetical protein
MHMSSRFDVNSTLADRKTILDHDLPACYRRRRRLVTARDCVLHHQQAITEPNLAARGDVRDRHGHVVGRVDPKQLRLVGHAA